MTEQRNTPKGSGVAESVARSDCHSLLGRLELVAAETHILREIADRQFHQEDIALSYALGLKSSERGKINWAKVNGAIVERWSRSGLERIKNMAWGKFKKAT